MYDILIKDTQIVDGTGNPWRYGNVAVKGGRIVAVGNTLSQEAALTLNGEGLVTCPGFVDFHAHSDVTLLVNPRAESAIRQGITTQVNGNCGFSGAPLAAEDAADLRRIPSYADLADVIPYNWQSMAEYLDLFRQHGTAINFTTMVGNSNLRRMVVGEDERAPTPEEMARMKRILARALEEGGWGLSTGLSFVPDFYSTTDELIELCGVVRRYGRIYATHKRNYTGGLMESTAEAIRIGEEACVPVDIAHFSGYGHENWGRIPEAIALVEAARGRGVDVAFDNPPVYSRGSSGGGGLNLLPPWALEGGTQKMLERMRDPEQQARAKHDVEHGVWDNWIKLRWDETLLTKVSTTENQQYVGQTITAIAAQREEEPIDTVFNLLLEEDAQYHMAPVVKSQEDTDYVVQHPLCKLSSDGRARAPYGPLAGCKHARSYGTYPRLLGRFVRERGVLRLEEAVRKMTSAPAARLGLTDRGLLQEGLAADICIFDPQTVIDRADWENTEAYPEGIETVIVNGRIVIHDGEHTGALPGRVLVP
jgi:N-acyl-D-amino-acid deacylase